MLGPRSRQYAVSKTITQHTGAFTSFVTSLLTEWFLLYLFGCRVRVRCLECRPDSKKSPGENIRVMRWHSSFRTGSEIPLLLQQQGSTPLMAGCTNAGQETIDGMICNICHTVHCSRHVGATREWGSRRWGEGRGGGGWCTILQVTLGQSHGSITECHSRYKNAFRSSTSLIQQFLNCSQWLRIAPILGWIICRQALQPPTYLRSFYPRFWPYMTSRP